MGPLLAREEKPPVHGGFLNTYEHGRRRLRIQARVDFPSILPVLDDRGDAFQVIVYQTTRFLTCLAVSKLKRLGYKYQADAVTAIEP